MLKGGRQVIDFDFSYFQPKTIEEAYEMYKLNSNKGKKVMYFNGGTEFISRARHNEVDVDLLIDIKYIPECRTYKLEDGELCIGASVTLSELSDQKLFPLLSTVVSGIATRTARNKITVGGNMCSDLPYKEACLPFLLAESTLVIATEKGVVKRPMRELFEIKDSEFIVQIITNEQMTKQRFTYAKRTRQSHVNYPIVTMTTMEIDNSLSVAVSGLCDVPIHTDDVQGSEVALGTSEIILDDELATKEYRQFVFTSLLQKALDERKNI